MMNFKTSRLVRYAISIGDAVCVGGLLSCGMSALAQSPVPTPAVVPNVAVITAAPVAFQKLTVKADFSTAYCLNNEYPIFSNVSLKGGVYSVILSHLRTGPCVTTKTLTLPGLPAGTYTLRVSVTADDSGGIQVRRTYETEVGQTTLTVVQPSGISAAAMCMARVDLPAYGSYGTGPVLLTGRCSEEPVFSTTRMNGTTPLEVGTATPSFFVYGAPSGTPLPSPFTQLYAVTYPAPLAGTFWTTSLSDCASLNLALNARSSCDSSTTIVLQANGGVCPLGTSAVYRVFQPRATAHRYTQSAATYAALVAANHVGEGIVWCALATD